jgi:predicted nucleic acid-binding protein
MNVVFVDSNVLIYSQDATDPQKQTRARDWLAHLWRTRSGRISFQVLREVYVNLTRHVARPVPVSRARDLVRQFLEWNPRPEDRELFELAWKVESRFQLSWWDSMIVAAAQLSHCRYLLSEDLGQGTRVNDLRVISPFSTSWESLEQAPE